MKTLKEIRKDLKNLNGENFKVIHSKVLERTQVLIGYRYGAGKGDPLASNKRVRLASKYLEAAGITFDITIYVDGLMTFNFFDDEIVA